jgi:hypothetical protein
MLYNLIPEELIISPGYFTRAKRMPVRIKKTKWAFRLYLGHK